MSREEPVPGIAAAASLPRSRRVSFISRSCNFLQSRAGSGSLWNFLGLSTLDFLTFVQFRTAQYNPLMLLHRIRIALFFVAAAVAVGAAQINKSWPPGLQQVPEDSPPLSPEEALKKFSMPPGYRVELVASEPLIQDPVMIDWDGEGRMWAVEMPGYMPDINAKG